MPALEPPAREPPALESSSLEFRLLGRCEIHIQGRPLPPPRYRKEWWLLALLVLKHDRELSRDTLAAAFWPDSDTDRALLYLRRSLTNLRHALGAEAARLSSPTPRTLRFDLSGAFADAVAFDRAVRKTPSHLPSEEALTQAVALYQGPLLPDCTEEWVLPEREERAQAYLAALEDLAQKATERGDPATAVHWLRRLVSADPRRESACGALMEALADGGDRAAVTQVYQDLRRLLRESLNTEPAPETRELYRRLMQQEARPPAAPKSPALPTPSRRHLPIPLSDLIGRVQEIEEVTGRLQRSRLVTLLGPGGVGKTRLAIGAAEAALPQFESGVWFVDLAPLNAPSRVAEAAAKALGIGEETGRSPEERLAEALSSAFLLLVLDNCEHVLDACASFSSRLLSACPHLRVLATSRQALGVPGEQVYSVPSLRLPPLERIGPEADPAYGEKNVSALLEYEAVRLFTERATQISPAFRLTRRNAEAVVEICRRLDGIPLALELAAARVRSLSPQEIGARLEDRFRLLVAGNRAAAPRHQTLRAAIDWSYGLLTSPECSLLHRLSVFAGGWRLEAAEAVCAGVTEVGTGSIEEWEVLDLLTSLTEKSLVSAETTGEGTGEATRYRLQETVRQYARERLRESGEEQAVRALHRDEFLHLTDLAKPQMQGPGMPAWLDRLEAEHDNLRAALDWCLEEPDGAQPGLQLAADLFFLWWIRGYFAEGQRRYAAVLGRPDAQARTPARAKALSRAGGLLSIHGDAASARPLFEEGLTIARELGDRKAEANLLCNLGDIFTDSDPPAAQAALEQSLALHREIGNRSGIAHSSLLLGNVALQQEHLTEAKALYAESLSLNRALGNPQKTGHALWCLARCGIAGGDYAQARTLLQECVFLFRDLKDPWGLSAAFALAGEAALQEAAYAQARPLLAEHLRLVTQMGLHRSAPWVLRCFGRLAAEREEWAQAARAFGAADTFQGTETPLSPIESSAFAAARDALGEAAFAAAWSAGKVLSLEQAARDAMGDG